MSGDELLRRVIEAPHLDAPRLAYADFLERVAPGHRHAEFIRLSLDPDADPSALDAMAYKMMGRWRIESGDRFRILETDRGFLSYANSTLGDLVDNVDRWFRRHPFESFGFGAAPLRRTWRRGKFYFMTASAADAIDPDRDTVTERVAVPTFIAALMRRREFDDEDEAIDEVERATAEWGRRRVGLPPLGRVGR